MRLTAMMCALAIGGWRVLAAFFGKEPPSRVVQRQRRRQRLRWVGRAVVPTVDSIELMSAKSASASDVPPML